MKWLLLSTAILCASALAAPAQDLFRGQASPDEIRASDLMGMRVYASEAAVDAADAEGPQEGWEDIGEINDVILSRDGAVEAVLVDIGGFLGMGERQAALSMDALRFVSDSATAQDVGDYFLVVNASRADLEEAPDYASTQMAAGAQGSAAAVEEATEATAAAGTEPTEEVSPNDADTAMTTVTTDPAAAPATTESEAEAADTAAAATGAAAGAAGVAGAAAGAAAGPDPHTHAPTPEPTGTAVEAHTQVAEHGTTVTTITPDAEASAGTAATAPAETAEAPEAPEAPEASATDEALSGEAAGRTPISREGYVAAPAEVMTADALEGAAVFDANDERVGEVGEILIDDAGAVTAAVVDVGGFLGIGEKAVALPMASLDVLQQEGGDDLRIYVSQTEEELEAMEAHSAE